MRRDAITPVSAIRRSVGRNSGGWLPRSGGTQANCIPASDSSSPTLARPAERIVAFYNQRGTAEQWIKESKGDKWNRLSCRSFAANAVRLQLHAPACER
jgi:hypothetical protein